ncbi:MAG: hypothetical protein LUD68_07435 [Rikenellaceae bacterium]|nr:hypothetical protein [Rikenellaceae bacterium]
MREYSTRRSFLLRRTAWILIGVGTAYAVLSPAEPSLPLILGLCLIGIICGYAAHRIEKNREIQSRKLRDEFGKAKPD